MGGGLGAMSLGIQSNMEHQMLRSIFSLIIFLFSFNIMFAQNSLDSIMFEYKTKFWSGKECVFVQGRQCDDFNKELNNIYEVWRSNPSITVKYEDQLDSTDLTKHLNFFGPIKSYKYLDKYLPSVISISMNGFNLSIFKYNDSLDAISTITSKGDRRFQLGNSFEGTMSLWTTFQDISQYFIMENYAITRHGYLNNDAYYGEKDYDVNILRADQLIKYETKYYSFFYDPGIFSSNQNIDSLFANEDVKLEEVINLLQFDYPKRKIECYLYKDLEQKYYLSATPGFGNPFPNAFQNHSVGFGPAEHESIHILMGNVSTIFSEGIVGYYYSTKDSLEWKKNKAIISQHPDFSIKDFLNNSNNFDFSELSYAASAHFAKYLIDTYGIEKFKTTSTYYDIKNGFRETYNKSFDEIADEWNEYYLQNKVELGPERKITFRIIATSTPDTSSIYITGDNSLLGRWSPNKIELSKQADGSWSRNFVFAEGTIFTYKITRGSWENEALNSNGNVPPNSVYEVKNDDIIIIKIDKWKDQFNN